MDLNSGALCQQCLGFVADSWLVGWLVRLRGHRGHTGNPVVMMVSKILWIIFVFSRGKMMIQFDMGGRTCFETTKFLPNNL